MRAAAPLLLAAGAAVANPNKWTVLRPGSGSICSHGTEWAFMHRKGTVNKLVVEFEGGGACWDAKTCVKGGSYKADVNIAQLIAAPKTGMHDSNNEANPFKEYYHVYLPYCTGDCHTGNIDRDYDNGAGTFHHRGHHNMMVAMNWTLANFPADPDAVVISGCSAGDVSTTNNWPFIADMYPKAKHYVFGDSYIGVYTPYQFNDSYANWNQQVPAIFDPDRMAHWRPDTSCYIHATAANHYPDARTGWYTSNNDNNQEKYYKGGGGDANQWTVNMRDQVKCYVNSTKNEHVFIAPGDAHCRSQDKNFYEVEADGMKLSEWVGKLVNDEDLPRVVDCHSNGACPLVCDQSPSKTPGC